MGNNLGVWLKRESIGYIVVDMRHVKRYIFFFLMCFMALMGKAVADSVKLIHYSGCVNIGIPDTLLLRVESPKEGISYHWQLPEEWESIGCTTCSELQVITHEKAAGRRIYGVSAENGSAFDTIQVRGADTALILRLRQFRYSAVFLSGSAATAKSFDMVWYKGSLSAENFLASTSSWILESQTEGQKPLLKYRFKENNACWSVTDEVLVWDSILPLRLAHYDGCVNIGIPDTLLLRVENADKRLKYHWQLPEEWEPMGDTNSGELRVVTHETKDTTRIYGVSLGYGTFFDTIHVRGADTTLIIVDDGDVYLL
ncbi:MAG: hypothetical protein NC114_01745, partial [Ruminococcus flavefaciens]|nr:hypothetical protein [Ruminococcus flavefaciens]